ncbi:16S rRNA pseudouridine(516) synthase [Thauera sp. CAU 1555]|uniref:Pseudouridine synthase n=1 Tax=Thauera sedimentorum TaxID=2767595 RepID=A0ABR9BBR0_9RHOO|nr:16S rRNA pseudouridine(516) synthase [Thauera sedimentorum]MBC9072869.1 16S rRNA pseudouridine(516) synthase [Thauera sedimentorum]MBD8503788.1 16S rRNA pseudouridine(516) synthase [Thauera sedimentorum]
MKLERLLHSQGFGSRKECRALIRAGLLSIAGETIDDPFADVSPENLVFSVDGDEWQYREKAYLVLHKPANYECSHQPQFHPSVFSLLPAPLVTRGVQCVGRLDQDSTGLMLLSDDGQFIHYWSSGKKRVPKVYEVATAEPVTDAQVEALLAGVQLHDEPAPIVAAACERTAERALRLTVTEGKYHQVKRMVAAAGNHVDRLHRSRIGGFDLPAELAPGEWRWLDEADLARLAEFAALS